MVHTFSAYQGSDPYVFVSYAHADDAVVTREIEWLHSQGFNVWYDEGISPGSVWRDEIAEAIENASLFLYFITPHSIERPNCQREVTFAVDAGIPLLAVHLEETALPGGMKLTLSSIQAILRYQLTEDVYRSKLSSALKQNLGAAAPSASDWVPAPASAATYRFGDWQVDPRRNELSRNGKTRRLEPKISDVLRYLLEHPGEVVSTEELMDAVWPGRTIEPGGVARNIAQIRRALGDDSQHPRYIETIPKRGYRTLAPVQRNAAARPIDPEAAVPVKAEAAAQTVNSSANAKGFRPNKWTPLGFGAALLVAVFGIGWYALRDADMNPADVASQPPEDEHITANAAMPPITAIAVMPFDDLSPNRDQQWLVDGMADELIDSLSRIEELRVPARSSTAILKEQEAEPRAIGERLDVGSILHGSILRADDRITVLVRWTRIEDGERMWSGRYERAFENILVVQRDITIDIAEAIRTELGISDASLTLSRQRYQTSDVRAWEALQKGYLLLRTYHPSLGPAKLLEAREQFRRALEFDPGYAEAHAQLADTDQDPAGQIEGAKRVLRMDATNITASAMLVFDSMLHWDFETAERMLDRLIAANPIARHHGIRHWLYLESGRLQAALDAAKWNVQFDPMSESRHTRLGHTYLFLGDIAKAIEHLEHGIALAREGGSMGYWPVHTHYELALAYHRVGRDADAMRQLHMIPDVEVDLAQTWAQANLFVARQLESGESPGAAAGSGSCPAQLLAEAGAKDRAYACLEAWVAGKNYPFQEIRTHPSFDPMRNEPRFQGLVRKLEKRIAEAAGTYEYAGDI